MLPHAIYFETLASIEDETSPEWQVTVAGLIALRLVDDWLDLGAHTVSTDITGMAAVRDAIGKVAEGNPIRKLLEQLVDSMESADKASVQVLAPPLFAYSKALLYESQYALARDVLATLQARAQKTGDTDVVINASLQLGFVWRHLGEPDLAEENYRAGGRAAVLVGNVESTLLARIGESKVAAMRGNLPLADSMLAAIDVDAHKAGIAHVIGWVLQDRAYVAHLRKDFRSAVRFGHQALEYITSERDRDRSTADLAAAFVKIGYLSAARNANLILAMCAQEQVIRWHANINLMYGAALERQVETFELYRASLEFTSLSPWAEIHYRRYAAEGLQILGNTEKSRQELELAHQMAEKHQMQQLVFEIEQDLEHQSSVQLSEYKDPDIDSIAEAISEQLRLQTTSVT